jgi:hypothetical protein
LQPTAIVDARVGRGLAAKDYSAEGLRGLAAVTVFLAHFWLSFFPRGFDRLYPGLQSSPAADATMERILRWPFVSILWNGNFAVCIFVWGKLKRYEYGGAPAVQMNEHQTTSITTSPWFESDVRLIESTIGVGFFDYGPRLWTVGEVEPLKALQNPGTIDVTIGRIIKEYPAVVFPLSEVFYRIRKTPAMADNPGESIVH